MNIAKITTLRLYSTLFVTTAELIHLIWEYVNGGVISHHFLNRSDMPAISNWWGLLWLPILTWITVCFIEKRSSKYLNSPSIQLNVIFGFLGSFLCAACLAFAFSNGYETVTSYLFPCMLLLALFLPVYRAESLLGFVLGMTLTIGAILPTIIGGVISLISIISHFAIWPLCVLLWKWFKELPAMKS